VGRPHPGRQDPRRRGGAPEPPARLSRYSHRAGSGIPGSQRGRMAGAQRAQGTTCSRGRPVGAAHRGCVQGPRLHRAGGPDQQGTGLSGTRRLLGLPERGAREVSAARDQDGDQEIVLARPFAPALGITLLSVTLLAAPAAASAQESSASDTAGYLWAAPPEPAPAVQAPENFPWAVTLYGGPFT